MDESAHRSAVVELLLDTFNGYPDTQRASEVARAFTQLD
jgi:hypothetical protein